MKTYQLAQINVARIKGVSIDDFIMKEFVDNLIKVNTIAESSEGFIWRLKDDSNSAVHFNPFNDNQVIINISVWKNITSLQSFVYESFHTHFLKRKKEWFQKYGESHIAMWWIETGHYPSVEQSIEMLRKFQRDGPTQNAFDFRNYFDPPEF